MGGARGGELKPCFDQACDLLALRPHFRRELAMKLERRGYPAADRESALDRLEAQGYLDDLASARGFVAARMARGEGRARLRSELERRGAAPAAVAAVLAELPEDDLPAARLAAGQWRPVGRAGNGGRAGHDAARAALARHLARKGFSRRAIFAVLNERSAAADPSAAPQDADATDLAHVAHRDMDDIAEAPDDFPAAAEERAVEDLETP
jgi:regulatory protein